MGAIGIGALTPSSGPGGPNRTGGTNRSDWGRPGGLAWKPRAPA